MGEGAGRHQRRQGRDGEAEPLQEDVAEDDGDAVPGELEEDGVHGRALWHGRGGKGPTASGAGKRTERSSASSSCHTTATGRSPAARSSHCRSTATAPGLPGTGSVFHGPASSTCAAVFASSCSLRVQVHCGPQSFYGSVRASGPPG